MRLAAGCGSEQISEMFVGPACARD